MDNIKLIAVDMDGTLLNSRHQVSAETIDKLQKIAASGIYVVPATGRCLCLVPEQVSAIPGISYAITANGAHVWDYRNEQTIFNQPMAAGWAARILERLKDRPGIIEAFALGNAYVDERCLPEIHRRAEFYSMGQYFLSNHQFVKQLHQREDIMKDIEKLNLYFLDEDVKTELTAELEAEGSFIVTTSLIGNIEVNDAAVSKGAALKHLCDHLGLRTDDIMVFGDGDNDREMFETAGYSVAMDNALDVLKDQADFVTKSNEADGVLYALNKLFPEIK